MNFILILVFVAIQTLGQDMISAEAADRFAAYRRSGLNAFLQRNYEQAENDLKQALNDARRLGPSDARLATALSDLSQVYRQTGRQSEGIRLLEQAVTILRTKDPDHYLCVVLGNLGQVYLA